MKVRLITHTHTHTQKKKNSVGVELLIHNIGKEKKLLLHKSTGFEEQLLLYFVFARGF